MPEEIIDIAPDKIQGQSYEDIIKPDPFVRGTFVGGTLKSGKATIGPSGTNKVMKYEPDKGLWIGHADFDDAPFKVNMEGRLTAKSISSLYSDYWFIGSADDGSTGGTTRSLDTTSIITDGTGENVLTSQAAATYSFGTDSEFSSISKFTSTTAQNAFLGFGVLGSPQVPAASDKYIGFEVVDGTLYASNANGSAKTQTEITGITLTDFNIYQWIFTAASKIEFYVNAVKVTTHTTNLPGTGLGNIRHAIRTPAPATARRMDVYNNYILTLSK